jgi:hypothetical protein
VTNQLTESKEREERQREIAQRKAGCSHTEKSGNQEFIFSPHPTDASGVIVGG